MITISFRSVKGCFVDLTFHHYKPTFSAPFTFGVAMNVNGFSCVQQVDVGYQYIQLSRESIISFVVHLQQVQQNAPVSAVLLAEEQRFRLSVQPYNKRGYILVRTSIVFEVQPDDNDGAPISNMFDGGFISEPAQIEECIMHFKHSIETHASAT